MSLAGNLKRLRKKRGWSQTLLAEQIGSHLSHINRIETGKYNPSLDVVQKLIDSLEEDDKIALIRVIGSMLTKKKILNLITKKNATEQRI